MQKKNKLNIYMRKHKIAITIAALLVLVILFGVRIESKKVETFAEPADPVALTSEAEEAWEAAGPALHASWANPDLRYTRGEVPTLLHDGVYKITAWKGERASAMFVLWSSAPKNAVHCKVRKFKADGATMPASIAQTHFVRYTLADKMLHKFRKEGGFEQGKFPEVLTPDMLDTLSSFDIAPYETRPVWVSINVPQDAVAGVYRTNVVISDSGRGKIVLPLELEVVNHVLPAPSEWNYHLDLWQHPSAVARAQGLELWSDAHFEAMKPLMKRLADAGQKVVTATLNKDPWNHQCHDAYEAMIKWTKHADGTWSYDYTVFDRWVQFMLDLGIDREINCYSMVPWNCEVEYFDEASGEVVTVKAEPGKKEFPVIWTPFLKDFKVHLSEKGWLELTNIAMDERSPEAMQAAADVLSECAPEMGFALADNHSSYKKFTMMRDVCVDIRQEPVSQADIDSRREKDQFTTFYICCVPSFPNTFSTSEPFEAEILGWYNIAYDYDGMLRWAYNSWPESPETDSRFKYWMCGDTYFVYPYNRSSVRFEKLIDGIEVAEKIRLLRKEGVDTTPVETVLQKIREMNITDCDLPWHDLLVEARAALDEVSR